MEKQVERDKKVLLFLNQIKNKASVTRQINLINLKYQNFFLPLFYLFFEISKVD